ncbi:MAG TPA: hypothetical protein PK537_11355, partial [Candidatus Limiplasma sp.]|nr:hypothetical protein [Candidatus Limiplasma sp.]
ISSSLGLHISSDADVGFGTSKMTLNNPDGEIEVGGTAALFVRSANPILTINGSDIQAWGPDGTELVNPHNVYLYPLQTRTTIIAQTLGLTDMDFVSHDYEDLATHIIFTPRPVQPPQTGDTSTPMLYVLLLLLAAAGIAALRVRAVKR